MGTQSPRTTGQAKPWNPSRFRHAAHLPLARLERSIGRLQVALLVIPEDAASRKPLELAYSDLCKAADDLSLIHAFEVEIPR